MVYPIYDDVEISGYLETFGTIYNRAYYNLLDNDGSTWINALLIGNSSPNTDFHIAPNYSTQSGGSSRVFFGYNSNWGSYNWMNGTNTLMSLDSSGLLSVSGVVAVHGGTSSVPGFWFGTSAPVGASLGGNLGIGLNSSNEIVLNAYEVKTARGGTVNNTLDDGYGNMIVSQSLWCNNLAVNGNAGIGGNLAINPSSGVASLNLKIASSTVGYFAHDGSNAYINCNGTLFLNGSSGLVAPPSTHNVWCGEASVSGYAWAGVAGNYIYSHSSYTGHYDEYDDLKYVKN